MGKLVVISGVGTGIGKTYIAKGLVQFAAAQGLRVAGYKPVESGVCDGFAPDAACLLAASTFHVKPSPLYALSHALSPHLAARREGINIELPPIVQTIAFALENTDLVVVELAGGLFSPLTEHLDNADLLAALPQSVSVLVAPDRLGVLHEVRATVFASRARALKLDVLALVAPVNSDASTGTNASELQHLFEGTSYFPRSTGTSVPEKLALEFAKILPFELLRKRDI